MTTYYVDSAASGANDGSSWTDAFADLNTAFGSISAGDRLLVDDGHSKDYGATTTITSPGTPQNPVEIISVDKADDSYSPGAVEKATGSTYTFSLAGSYVSVGVNYEAGYRMEIGPTSNSYRVLEDCYLKCGVNSTGSATIEIDGIESTTKWFDVDAKFNGSGQHIYLANYLDFLWDGGSVIADATAPDILFDALSRSIRASVKNVDLSLVSSALVDDMGAASTESGAFVSFEKCLLHASVALSSDTIIYDCYLRMHGCDDAAGDLLCRFEEIDGPRGTTVQDTSVYLNWEYDGTNKASAKMVSTANVTEWINPMRFKLAEFWSTANPTITVELVLDSATALNNDDFWIEIEYPDSTNPNHGQVDKTSRPASALGSPSALTSSSVSWTGTGGFSNEQKRKIEETISGGADGPHTVWVCLAKPSITVYVDPEVMVS